MKNKVIFLFAIVIILMQSAVAQSTLKQEIEQLVSNKKLKLGFAFYSFSTEEYFQINGNKQFPMQSVYKFPISMAILNEIDKGKYALIDTLNISKADLHQNTWSPLRDKFPNGTKTTIAELIRYTVQLSDNNCSDIVLRKIGGADAVQKFLDKNNITQIKVRDTEFELHKTLELQFRNYATPNEIINLLQQFYSQKLLSSESNRFLWQVMSETQTGSIRDSLPSDIVVAYKTGFSGMDGNGVIAAQNCVGIMQLPNNQNIAFAIFVTQSKEGERVTASVIAEIAKIMYRHIAM